MEWSVVQQIISPSSAREHSGSKDEFSTVNIVHINCLQQATEGWKTT